jgi:hypothetical protein
MSWVAYLVGLVLALLRTDLTMAWTGKLPAETAVLR